MPILLVSLGTSPAIVPEAFLLPGVDFDEVHVLTTETTDVAFVEDWFRAQAPQVTLSITRVAGFSDFRSEDEHFLFEEVLYRWWLEKVGTSFQLDAAVAATVPVAGSGQAGSSPSQSSQAGGFLPHVCLSGGFKTMSAAVQKAAAVLGAAEVFHVLCALPPKEQPDTAEKIEAARANDHLHWIKLGPESGWPQLRNLHPDSFPLSIEKQQGCINWASSPDRAFRDHLRGIVQRSHNISGSWDRLGELPFSVLATWSARDLEWLQQPLDPVADAAWIHALPKVDLHCHLGGFATHGPLLAEVRAAAKYPQNLPPLEKEPAPPDGWPEPESPVSLEDYMRLGNANGSALLKDPGCLKRHIELLYQHFLDQNLSYVEVRCSPANYATKGRSPFTVLSEIKETFDNVAASFQLADPVPPCFQHGDSSATSPQLASPRQFHPFEKDADYHQTWRDLPHRHQSGATAFVTFRLADSIPAEKLQIWHREQTEFLASHPKPWDRQTWETYRRNFPQRLDDWLDQPHGSCLLRNPANAAEVESALLHFDGERYILDEFVIMPNHVHALVKPLPGHDLEEILHSWKSYTANRINKRLDREGQLWEHESFDHLVRSSKQLERLRDYIRSNPEKAGLQSGFVVGRGTGLLVDVPEPSSSRRHDATDQPSRRLAATCHVNLLIIGTRTKAGDHRTAILRHLMLAVTAAEHWAEDPGCRVVGVDLAGFEDKETRAHYYQEDFRIIHRAGLALTVHAGENDDSEAIWSAVFDLNTRRIGHALSLRDSKELLRSVADRRIGLEMCPYANYQIKGFFPMPGKSQKYPLLDYLTAGIPVTVNTDNIGISAASLTDNILFLSTLCPGIRRIDILRLLRNAIDQSFLGHLEKNYLLSSIHIPNHLNL